MLNFENNIHAVYFKGPIAIPCRIENEMHETFNNFNPGYRVCRDLENTKPLLKK